MDITDVQNCADFYQTDYLETFYLVSTYNGRSFALIAEKENFPHLMGIDKNVYKSNGYRTPYSLYPETKLIIVDTLERIRDTEQDKSMYSCDYRDMTALRDITNKHKLTLLLVHHTRKMYDPDPLNTLSGSTGLVGSVDGVFVLLRDMIL
jgi:hypothetical protein